MQNLIEWIIEMLSKDGINSKGIVKTTLEEMTIDDWYHLRNSCNEEISNLRSKGFKPEDNPSILLLKSYQSDVYQCSLLQREIDVLSNFVKAPSYDGMPFTPPKCNNPVEEQHIRLIEAKHNLEHLLAAKGYKLQKCINLINSVSDSRGRYILTGIFLDNKNLYQIMRDAPFELSYKQICRIKKASLDEIRRMQGGADMNAG